MAREQRPFEGVVRDHWDAIYRVALRLVGTAHDAEDIAQETFLQAYRAWHSFRGDGAVRTWLVRIAVNLAGRTLRARAAGTDALPEDVATHCDPAQPIEQRERATRIRDALARLRPLHRLTLTLFLVDGLSHRELAHLMECPEGTVWSRLHNAKKALEKELRR